MSTGAVGTARERLSQGARFKDLGSIVISVTALFLSLVSLFMTQLEPAKVHVFCGDYGFVITREDKLFRLNLYLVFSNSGAKPGVAERVAVLLQRPGMSDGYLLPAKFFQKLEPTGVAAASVADPIPVGGHQTVNRQIEFISSFDTPGDFLPMLVTGEYRATVLVWTSADLHPTTTASFPFELTDRDLQQLGDMRAGKNNTAVQIQNKNFERWGARTINKQEIDELLR